MLTRLYFIQGREAAFDYIEPIAHTLKLVVTKNRIDEASAPPPMRAKDFRLLKYAPPNSAIAAIGVKFGG